MRSLGARELRAGNFILEIYRGGEINDAVCSLSPNWRSSVTSPENVSVSLRSLLPWQAIMQRQRGGTPNKCARLSLQDSHKKPDHSNCLTLFGGAGRYLTEWDNWQSNASVYLLISNYLQLKIQHCINNSFPPQSACFSESVTDCEGNWCSVDNSVYAPGAYDKNIN